MSAFFSLLPGHDRFYLRGALLGTANAGDLLSAYVLYPVDYLQDRLHGVVVTFNARIGSIQRGKTLAVERVEAGRVWLDGHNRPVDPGRQAEKLAVSLPRTIELCPGDKILVRRNHREAGLVNGQVLTVTKLCADGSLETREGKLVPSGFRHFCHGYVVTSHKAQGRTHDQVVIAAEQLDSKAAYVACSRGRHQARIFTPGKEHLFERLERTSDRLAASDVIGASRTAFWRHNDHLAWQRAADHTTFFHAAFSQRPALEREMSP